MLKLRNLAKILFKHRIILNIEKHEKDEKGYASLALWVGIAKTREKGEKLRKFFFKHRIILNIEKHEKDEKGEKGLCFALAEKMLFADFGCHFCGLRMIRVDVFSLMTKK